MSDERKSDHATNREPNAGDGKAHTTEGRCDGCGRRLVLVEEPALLKRGILRYRVEGSALAHEPGECVAAHVAPDRGALAYRGDGRVGGVPRVLPPDEPGVHGGRKRRRDAMRQVGVR